MAKTRHLRSYNRVQIMNKPSTKRERVMIGVFISIISFMAISVVVFFANNFGLYIEPTAWNNVSYSSEGVRQNLGFWNDLGNAFLWVLYWLVWPIRLLLGIIAAGTRIMFGS